MTAWTKAAVEELLQSADFRYHRVPLPHGLATPGQDRSGTAALVLPADLTGKTVLDVGCALGYFSFEAEKRGAARVVAVELRDDRFAAASKLKDVLGSRIELIQRDVLSASFAAEMGQSFDLVLFLNVIHHLAEPAGALRALSAITRGRLVIEFPTLSDERFAKSAGLSWPGRLERLPLIGVSSTEKGTGQTFVFTREAIRRIVQDHAPLFRSVQFVKSPMKGRAIALCDK